jgi:DNA-binding transcriptional MerR regulator
MVYKTHMIRIGDFSRLSRVSVKTLRYYDEMGLLKPVEVDKLTGYRIYAYSQLSRLYRILALKDLGFSLEQISRLLDDGLSVEQMRGMLKLRETESRQRVKGEAQRLERIQTRLRQIEQENFMSKYDVVIKKIEPMKIASVRGVVPTPPDQRTLWEELMDDLNQRKAHMVGTPMAIYHDPDFRERDWDIEVCMPVGDGLSPTENVKVYDLPAVESMACVVHAGPFATLFEAYDALGKWIDENGYQIVGPARELNLQMPETAGDQNDPNTINEVQFPVEKG